ncbi:Retrovirus-related Pol polyprotein [Labeo rohita]|uniref:Gypsy retrotransposon integrase-like protein 1 n=1 Tax=Labeo rohita TaxID=84645 RepID=A0ABQ8M0W5_LABRO|nr:Retrovirus-related Pol polyprotein [Labeo rohita]
MCLLPGLFEKRVLSDVEEQEESSVAIESPVAPVTPLNAGEVKSSLSMPKFELLSLSTDASPTSQVEAHLKVRLARLQLEAQDKAQARRDELQHQLEKYWIEADTKIRLRQLELQVKQETGVDNRSYVDPNAGNVNSVDVPTESVNNPVFASTSVLGDPPSAASFSVAKNIVLVPPFREKEVEAYFQAFERIAMALKWPSEAWSLMLQCKLTGKAQEVCASLSLEESVQYDAVKNAILRAYDAVSTRAQVKAACQQDEVDLSDTVLSDVFEKEMLPTEQINASHSHLETFVAPEMVAFLPVSRESLIEAQNNDCTLETCRASVAMSHSGKHQFFWDNDVLMRKWNARSLTEGDSDWGTVNQIVVPSKFRQHILAVVHDHPWAGHLGVTKTYDRILQHFFWPGLKTRVSRFCKTCHTCQMAGKPNQVVSPAPLYPIPAVGEAFERVIVDCVGRLPHTKTGNQYLLTIMCVTTRFPEAVPLRKITAATVTKALVKFFTTFGLPRIIQTDQGSNFLSKVFRKTMKALGISHVVSSSYHPESQGALERWHQTLKSTLRKYCLETENDWDDGIPMVPFAVRDARQESLGFSPAELVFGHNVRGPLKVLKDQFLSVGEAPKINVLDFVTRCRERLYRACATAKDALCRSQEKMKRRYDKHAVVRNFLPGEKVLVLLPVLGAALAARFSGPYVVKSKVSGDFQFGNVR